MNLVISGHHLEVTQALRAYVTKKLDGALKCLKDVTITSVNVKLSVGKLKEKERAQKASVSVLYSSQ